VALVVGVKEEANVGWAGGGGSRDEVTDLVHCGRSSEAAKTKFGSNYYFFFQI